MNAIISCIKCFKLVKSCSQIISDITKNKVYLHGSHVDGYWNKIWWWQKTHEHIRILQRVLTNNFLKNFPG